jgi:hypothetical protein
MRSEPRHIAGGEPEIVVRRVADLRRAFRAKSRHRPATPATWTRPEQPARSRHPGVPPYAWIAMSTFVVATALGWV